MAIKISGSVLVAGSTEINETEFGYLNAQTVGAAKASAAVVLGSSKQISGLGDVSAAALSGSGNLNIGGTVQLDGAADAVAAVTADSFYFMDADDNLVKKESMADYATAIAGSGLAAASGVLSVDLNEVAAAAVDVAADSLLIIDADDSNATKKESFADLMTAAAGDGLGASTGVLAVNVDDSSIETDSDTMRVKALGITNAMLSGSIANAKLSNSTVSFGGVSLALGASDATPAFNLSGATDLPVATGLSAGTFAAGTWNFSGSTITDLGTVSTADIDGGAMDGVTIGANSAAAATVTTLDASGLASLDAGIDVNNEKFTVSTAGAVVAASTLNAQGAVDFDSTLNVDGASTLAALTATTISGSGAANLASLHCDSVDLDGGAMDGVIIGAEERAAASVTTLDANGASTLQAITATTISGSGAANLASLHCDSVDLDGGSMDSVVIGEATAAQAWVTNLSASGDATIAGALDAEAAAQFNSDGDATGDLTWYGQGGSNRCVFDASNAHLSIQGSNSRSVAASSDYRIDVDAGLGGMRADEFVTYSDRTLKTNIQKMDGALEKVMKLEAVTYDKTATGKSEIGFIAQDVAKVVPEICALDANGEGRGIDYSRMSAVLVGALKTQQDQIAQLKEIVAKLQK